MPGKKIPLEGDTVNIDQIVRCQTFEELKQSDSFRQFIRILSKKRPELFSGKTGEEESIDYS